MAGTISENLEELPEEEEGLEEEPGEEREEFGRPIEPRKPKKPAEKKDTGVKNAAGTAEKGVEAGEKAAVGAVKAGAGVAEKAAAGAAAKGAGAAAGTAIGGPVGTALGYLSTAIAQPAVDIAWKYGKWVIFVIGLFLLSIILLMAAMLFSIGSAGREGSKPIIDLNPKVKADYHDVLYDLALAGSKEDKLKLLISKNAEIYNRLMAEKSSMQAVKQTSDIKRSIELIDEMWKHIFIIGNLGKQIKNTPEKGQTQFDLDKKNKELIKQIDEEYIKWLPLWQEFEKVFPGFQGPKNVNDYINFLKKYNINAVLTDGFWAPRSPTKSNPDRTIHAGYDFAYSDGSPVISGWDGTVSRIVPWDYYVANEYCVYVSHNGYEIGYGHIYVANGIKVGTPVSKGDVLGTIVPGSGHVDIKITQDGKYVEWDKDPVY